MKEIPVGKNHFAMVDDDDYTDLIQFGWYLLKNLNSRTIYAIRGKAPNTEYMHTRITGYEQTDHKDGNGLNNCRSNLRQATTSQNHANMRKWQGTYSSRYKGVHWRWDLGKWSARIGVNYKRISLGFFDDEVEAARAYDRAALRFFGEFAYLNFRDEPPDQPLRTDSPDETPGD